MDRIIIWSQEKYDEYEGQIKRFSFLISKTSQDIRDLKALGYSNSSDKLKELRKLNMEYHKRRREFSELLNELEKVRQKQTTLF
jgi:predicted  nucleic acid-binding Zn-ribbon protein